MTPVSHMWTLWDEAEQRRLSALQGEAVLSALRAMLLVLARGCLEACGSKGTSNTSSAQTETTTEERYSIYVPLDLPSHKQS